MASKLLVITTKGCKSCNIIKQLIDVAIPLSAKKVKIEYKDYTDCDITWLKQENITDFPTTLLIKDDLIKFKFVGTKPAIIIARWIRIHL